MYVKRIEQPYSKKSCHLLLLVMKCHKHFDACF